MYYGFVYEWTNCITGKKYIGSHRGTVDDGYVGSGIVFRKALEKYGIENFTREILEYVDVPDRQFLLLREKHYLDMADAYNSTNYYNVAKDVIGGDTRAGWSDIRRQEFSDHIREIWARRSPEEKTRILGIVNNKTKEWYKTQEGENFKEKLRANVPKLVEGSKKRSKADRSRSAKLGKERMGEAKRKEAARKGVQNRNPVTEKLAREKASQTRASWTDDRQAEVSAKISRSRKGKCTGSENGRARQIVANGQKYGTLKEAMVCLNISEYKLYKRLNDPENIGYYYAEK